MGGKLVQRRGLFWRTCTLVADGIRVREWSPGRARTFTVAYEVLFGEREDTFTSSKGSLLVMAVTGGIAISVLFSPTAAPSAAPIWGVCAAFAGVYYLASRCDELEFIDGRGVLRLFRDCPSTRAVDKFLAEARRRAHERIRERVLPLRRSDDPVLDREHAVLLRDKGIITDDEYADFTQEPASGSERAPN